MPPTFLLYVGAVAAAAVAPIILIAAIVASCSSRHRQFGVRVLLGGLGGGIAAVSFWVAVIAMFANLERVDEIMALTAFGTGFTGGAIVLGGWQISRRVLSNHALNTDAVRSRRAG